MSQSVERKHAKAVAAYTLDHLQLWQSGERAGLWESRRPPVAMNVLPSNAKSLLRATPWKATAVKRAQPFSPTACATRRLPHSMVAKALCNYPVATALGPCGLGVQHLPDACPPGTSGTLHKHLAALFALLANGQACE